ncbi:hypothetical protein [Arthrobacter psychrochitiniphilus]|uniref:DoxX family protein n=1 Tax=Arthrobacter psychrochitiniphilus TaxID=291045 RepID=A0A2V3DVY4_9MICC|nr:hypothetical protein [Arthrobacter psychrochitiniphilus]NYG15734.1 hypothetical protein [Arthrobacter psychrochitiniphilus]PXA66801.1 hypothetical protein CVS29_04335 [Arthrobacter psychrochitiniphilus]
MATHSIPAPSSGWSSQTLTRVKAEPAYGAFLLLWVGFITIPLIMGVDKFFNVLTHWENYLAPWIENVSPFSAHGTMMAIGVVEIIAAIAMILRPRYAAYIVALWLAGIIVNLLTYPGFYDVALRDFGLMVAAIALTLLARTYTKPGFRHGGMK